MAQNCSTCKHAIFCPTWGNHKCMKRRLRIENIADITPCAMYEEGSPEVEKCQCEDCLENDFEE